MKLVSKITLMLVGMTIVMAGLNYTVLNATVTPSFAELERATALQNSHRIEEAITREVDFLTGVARDWGFWTETQQYVLGNNPGYADVQENLTLEALTVQEINSLFVVDLEGNVVWGMSVDLDSEEEISIAELPNDESWQTNPLLHSPDANADSLIAGLIMTDQGMMAVSSVPVLDSNAEDPNVGTFVFGKLINEPFVAGLAEQTSVEFELLASNAAEVPADANAENGTVIQELSDTVLASYQVLSDVAGTPISVIKAQTPRDISQNGQRTLVLALSLLIAAGIAGIGAVALGLHFLALRPLHALSEMVLKVARTGNLKHRSNMERSDEIGILSKQFDEMLGELATAREAMREQSYYTGILEMSAGLMHNLRNSLNPVKTGIWAALEVLRHNRLENFNRAIKELSEMDVDADRRRKLFEFVNETATAITDDRTSLIVKIEKIGSETDAIATILDQQNRLNRPELCVESVDLNDILEVTQKPVAEVPGIILDIACDDNEPLVMGNQILLSQVLENIVRNAVDGIKATGNEHGTIKILVTFDRNAATPSARITIKDDGCGIPTDLLPRLFERGYSTKEEASGLGLHWCSNTLIAMGGKIAVDSAGAGKGVTVQIDLKSVVGEQKQEEAA